MSILNVPAARRATPFAERQFFRHVLFCISVLLAVLAFLLPARSEEGHTLIIPANDGYGFEECLTPGSQCGLVVADAWCKAHGFGGSRGFRPETADTAGVPAGSVRVTCGAAVD
ncbi:MAG TPA: hypothetical protein VKE72_10755 [Methylocella sp.]|nr:hypothetical protein [Methylocella sp.]